MLLKLTSIGLLIDKVFYGALVGDRHLLLFDRATPIVEALRLIHSFLQGVTFPSKHIVCMGTWFGELWLLWCHGWWLGHTITSRATLEAPHKGVRRSISPQAIEFGCIPHSLEGYLRYPDWVGRWALGSVSEPFRGDGIVSVRLVIWAV